MPQLKVIDNVESHVLQMIAKYGEVDVEIVKDEKLFFDATNETEFLPILHSINKLSKYNFIDSQLSDSIGKWINTTLRAIHSKQFDSFLRDLNDLLALNTYIVGNSLSAADVVAYAALYSTFASLSNEQKHSTWSEISRWFDLVQHKMESTKVLSIIPIKDVPKDESKKDVQDESKKDVQAESKNNARKKHDGEEKHNEHAKPPKKQKKSETQPSDELKDHLNELEFIQNRVKLFDEIYNEQTKKQESLPSKSIKVTLPDGSVHECESWKTTPMDIANKLSKSLAKNAIVAKVNDKLYDMTRPLEEDCQLKILTFDDPEAKHVFWHSSSHVLGQSLERLFGGKLTVGPALDPSQMLHNGGFYYDVDIHDEKNEAIAVSQNHYDEIEKLIKNITNDKQPFYRVVLTKEQALKMFSENKFKQELISEKIPDGSLCTAYRCGPLIDLCKGPHIPNTNLIKALKIVKNGATYWKNDKERESLQRIYGISFPDNKLMKDYEELKKKIEESDHRYIGKQQKLFFFDELSPGSCFWLPHGARIYNKLVEFVRQCYRDRGYTEVITPNVYNFRLWEISGHAANYAENIFQFEVENQKFGLKPMNCPGHCLMYKHEIRSYRDLPIRFADFGVLHRNELSGSLTGLTRVRRFQQDDAHIFCRQDQIRDEIFGCLEFLNHVYSKFGFEFGLELSTRPQQKYLGEIETWDEAEKQLSNCLDEFVAKNNNIKPWKLNPGDGAFYGPKIDIKVYDSLRREHQCATIQLDFQLPIRFELEYTSSEKQSIRPVIVHRAIYGSLERFIAILCEHISGKWPFWISPRQVIVIPISKEYNEYAIKVNQIVHSKGYHCDVDESTDRLNKKIRNAEISQYNYILVVGDKEQQSNSVNVRTRDNQEHGMKTIDDVLLLFQQLTEKFQ